MPDSFGLKIGIEGEKEFKKSLSEINQSFKVLGSEMKLVSSEFDKNDKSIQALTARNAMLIKSIEEQKKKVSTLEAALKNASETFGENDRRTKNWSIQLNLAQAELNDLERELKQTSEDAERFGDGMDESGEKAEASARKVSKFASTLKGLAMAMGTAMLAAGTLAYQLGKEVVANFKELEQNLGGSEAVFGEYAASIQKSGEEAYKNLGVSQSQYLETANKMGALFQGSGLTQQKSLELTEKAMQRAADMASVMGIDMQMALDSVAGAAKGNFTMMDNLGIAMNATTVEAYAVSKGLDFVWASASNAEKAEVAMQMFFENTQQYAGNFAKESTETVSGSLGLFQAALGSFTAGLGNTQANMVNLTVNLTDAFQSVVKNLVPVIQNLVASLPIAVVALLDAVEQLLPLLLETLTGLFTQMLETLMKLLPKLIPAIVDVVMEIVSTLVDHLPLMIDTSAQFGLALVLGFSEALPELIPAIVEAILLIVDNLLANTDKIIEAAFQLMQGLAQGLLKALPKLLQALPQILSTIIQFFSENLPSLLNMGATLLLQLIAGLIQAIPQLLAALPQIVEALLISLREAFDPVFEIGKNIVLGLWEGITSLGNWFKEKLSDWFGGIVSNVKGFLGIRSPSLVFAGIGENMGFGLGEGFLQAMTDVEKEMKQAIPTNFNIDAELQSVAGDATPRNQVILHEHRGVLELRGVNDKGQFVDAVRVVMDELRRGSRV